MAQKGQSLGKMRSTKSQTDDNGRNSTFWPRILEISPHPTLSQGDCVVIADLTEETIGFQNLRMRSFGNGSLVFSGDGVISRIWESLNFRWKGLPL
jgi:hypothetical protein